MLSARWLLEYFQANTTARLEHRQQLEREHGDAPFATGEALERRGDMFARAALGVGVSGRRVVSSCGGAALSVATLGQVGLWSHAANSSRCSDAVPTRRTAPARISALVHGSARVGG